MKKDRFIASIRRELGIKDDAYAEVATEAVLKTLHDRLTEGQSRHVESHLPRELKPMWAKSLQERLLVIAWGPEKMTKKEFLSRVQTRSHVADTKKSEELTLGVFRVLKKQLPESDADHVAGQLPRDLKKMWVSA